MMLYNQYKNRFLIFNCTYRTNSLEMVDDSSRIMIIYKARDQEQVNFQFLVKDISVESTTADDSIP